jgi:hypothetical protein
MSPSIPANYSYEVLKIFISVFSIRNNDVAKFLIPLNILLTYASVDKTTENMKSCII